MMRRKVPDLVTISRKGALLGQVFILDSMRRLLDKCDGVVTDDNFTLAIDSYDAKEYGPRFGLPAACHILANPLPESVCLRFRVWFKDLSGKTGGDSQFSELQTYKQAQIRASELLAEGFRVENEILGVVWDNATGSFAEVRVLPGT